MATQVQQALTNVATALNDFINSLPAGARTGTNQFLQANMNIIIMAIPEKDRIEQRPLSKSEQKALAKASKKEIADAAIAQAAASAVITKHRKKSIK